MNASGPVSESTGTPREPATVDSAHALELELARRLLNLVAALVLAAGGVFLVANLWARLLPETLVSAAALLAAAFIWRDARRHARPRLGIRLLTWTAFLGLSGGLLRQGDSLGPALWWLSALPLLLLQGGLLADGVVMTALIVAQALFVDQFAAMLGVAPVDPQQLGSWRRDLAIAGALTVNALVLLMGIRWRRALLAQLDEARQRAEDAAQVKSRFLANMSHEIRTPLHGIVGATELLRGTRLDEGQRQVLSVLRRSSSALMSLVDDVLDFSKLEAGRMRASRERFDLHDAVHDAAEVFSAQAEAKGVDLLSHCTADLPASAVGDAARLRQILHNLVGNAVKFTERGEVRVFAAPERDADGALWMRVSVRDTGIGMDQAQVARLFEAFAQADLSTTRRFGGTGLGLAIARELAALLGGHIEVQSLPGQGSTFMLLLPLADAAEPPAAAPSLAGVEVRIVSSSRSRREDIEDLVRRHGGRCTGADSLPALQADAPPGCAACCCATPGRSAATPPPRWPTGWRPAASAVCCWSARPPMRGCCRASWCRCTARPHRSGCSRPCGARSARRPPTAPAWNSIPGRRAAARPRACCWSRTTSSTSWWRSRCSSGSARWWCSPATASRRCSGSRSSRSTWC